MTTFFDIIITDVYLFFFMTAIRNYANTILLPIRSMDDDKRVLLFTTFIFLSKRTTTISIARVTFIKMFLHHNTKLLKKYEDVFLSKDTCAV